MAAPAKKKPGASVKVGPRVRTPQQLERQEKVFELSVLSGNTHRQIAVILHIDKMTVASDIRAESERRAGEIAERRETEQAQHVARLDDFYQQSMALRAAAGTGALGAAGKALEMRAKILGLDAPTRVEIGVQSLLDALDTPPDKT